MIGIQKELVQLQVDFVQLIDRWNGLSRPDQTEAWATYTNSLDEGMSGYHPFCRLLINAWCDGWSAIGGVALDNDGSLRPANEVTA